jgi:hypothetical protein
MKIRDLLGENWKRDAYQRDYDSSRTGFSRPPREDDEYVNGDEDEVRSYNQYMARQHQQADAPHDVHINGKKWKSFGSHSHASNVAKKIKGATVHKSVDEALPLDQLRQASGYDASKDAVSQQLAKIKIGKPVPPLVPGKPMPKPVGESATAGATSAASIGTVDAPHFSPGKARGKKSYTGSPGTGSGTKAPPQPKVVQPKTKSGTAVNGLDIKSASLFGGPKNEAQVIKRR